ncbi:MAG: glycosyltransferase [Pseudomonadota bacterium]
MKIVHFFRSPVGGIFRHVRDLLAEQSAAGHQVGIICDANTGGDYENQLFEQIQPQLNLGLHRISMARSISPLDIATLFKARALISELSPDVVHCHSAKAGIHGRIAARYSSSPSNPIKAFYCPHGGAMHYDAGSLKGKVFFTAERFMERFTARLVFVSEYERNAYHEKVGKPRCPEAIVYNGLATEEFEPVAPLDEAKDFMYIGMMRDLKGPDLFLEALGKLQARREKKITAMFVGDGPDKDKYLHQIKNLGLVDCVSVYPAMPAREAFSMAKVIVVPSRAESMPYLVLEAIAAQMPIVATCVGGIPEIFQDRSEDLVPPGDAGALAEKMLSTLEDETRETRARTFAEQLKTRFSLPVMAESVETIYRD